MIIALLGMVDRYTLAMILFTAFDAVLIYWLTH